MNTKLVIIILIVISFIIFIKRKRKENITEELKIATDADMDKAYDFAMYKICNDKGYHGTLNPDGTMSCRHTKESCQKESLYPATDEQGYYEWREDTKSCIVGDSGFRKFCQDKELLYNIEDGSCKVNRNHCDKYGVSWDDTNKDCMVTGGQGFAEFFLSKTMVRGIDEGLKKLVSRCDNLPCKEGEGCLIGKGHCDSGLFCHPSAKCEKKRDKGSYCPLNDSYCKDDLFCAGSSTCQEKHEDGFGCSTNSACKSNKCGASSLCLDKDGYSVKGAHCSLFAKCGKDLWCGGIPVKCREKGNENDGCVMGADACKSGLFCDVFKCKKLLDIDEKCSLDHHCKSGNCVEFAGLGKCRPEGEDDSFISGITQSSEVISEVANATGKAITDTVDDLFVTKHDNGRGCIIDSVCKSGACIRGFCQNRLGRDSLCSDNHHCKSNKCNSNRNSWGNVLKYCE